MSLGINYSFSKGYDLIIYGATPAGVAAAVNAARQGVSVALVEETDHVGGLASSGLSNTDFHSFESLGIVMIQSDIQHYNAYL